MLLQNYTFVEPFMNPLVLFAVMIGAVFVMAFGVALWMMRTPEALDERPTPVEPEPFVAEPTAPMASTFEPDWQETEVAVHAPESVPADGPPAERPNAALIRRPADWPTKHEIHLN